MLYVTWACALLVTPCWRAAGERDRLQPHRIGYGACAVGFSLALPLPGLYLLSSITEWAVVMREVCLWGAIAAVVFGLTIAAYKPPRSGNPMRPMGPAPDSAGRR